MAVDEVPSHHVEGEHEVHLDAVLDHVDAAFAIKSLGGVYEFANRAFLKLFDLHDSPVAASHFSSLPADLAGDMWQADVERLDRTAWIVEQAQSPLALVDLEGVITYANAAMSALTKTTDDARLPGRRLSDVVAIAGETPISIADALASQPFRGEARVLCGDCEVLTAWMTTGALLAESGESRRTHPPTKPRVFHLPTSACA